MIVKGKSSTKLELTIRDTSDSRLVCTFWSACAKQVSDFFEANKEPCVVLVARFVSVREYKGVFTVSNAFNATELSLNPELKEVVDFRSKLPRDGLVVSTDHSAAVGTPCVLDLETEFLGSDVLLSIYDLYSCSEVGRHSTICKVDSVETIPRWYYVCCRKCKTAVHPCEGAVGGDESLPLFDCTRCNENVSDVLVRFKLVLCVSDDTGGTARFILFDNVALPFLGTTAHVLAEEVAEENSSVLPNILSKLVGKTYLFKVTVSADNLRSRRSSFKVDIISEDRELMSKCANRDLDLANAEDPVGDSSSVGVKRPLFQESDENKSDENPRMPKTAKEA